MKQLLLMLRRRLMATWLGYTLAFIFAAMIPVSNYFTLQSSMQKMRIAVPDIKGGYLYLDNVGSFDSATKLHCDTARMAAETMFNRNPSDPQDKSDPYGFDDPERKERLFNPETTELLNRDAARDADTFRIQQIHQKIEIGPVREVGLDNDTAVVAVEGQILGTFVINQHTQPFSKNVTILFRLKVNGDIATNGRFPLVVTKYDTYYASNTPK